MSENNPSPGPAPDSPRPSLGVKLGIGAALIAVPIGSAFIFLHLKSTEAHNRKVEEQGAAYDTAAFSRIDPAAIKFQQSGQIATGLKYARAIAIDKKGDLLIAGDRKVRILGKNAEPLLEFPLADYPSCIAGGPGGTILVGFRDHVEVFSADGKLQKVWKSFGPRSQLTGLAVTTKEIYIADAGRREVVRCDLEGNVLGELGKRDDAHGNPGLILPSPFLNVSTTADGQLLVSDPGRHRVETYNPDGELESFWGIAGAGLSNFIGCCNPSHLAIMTDGRIVTAEKGVARIKVYSPDGQLFGVVAGPDVLGTGVHGFELAIDNENRILVLEPGATEIRIFTPIPDKTAGAL